MRVFSYLANHFFQTALFKSISFYHRLSIHHPTSYKFSNFYFLKFSFIFDYLVIFLLLLSLNLNLFNLMTLKY